MGEWGEVRGEEMASVAHGGRAGGEGGGCSMTRSAIGACFAPLVVKASMHAAMCS